MTSPITSCGTDRKSKINDELSDMAEKLIDRYVTQQIAESLGVSPLRIREIIKQKRRAYNREIDAIQKACKLIHVKHRKYFDDAE